MFVNLHSRRVQNAGIYGSAATKTTLETGEEDQKSTLETSRKEEILRKIDSMVRVLELQIARSSRVLMQLIDFV